MNKSIHFLLTAALAASALSASAQVSVNINVPGLIQVAPPTPRYEPMPGPRSGQVWVPGHWQWGGRDYVWRGGYWQTARPDYAYAPGGMTTTTITATIVMAATTALQASIRKATADRGPTSPPRHVQCGWWPWR